MNPDKIFADGIYLQTVKDTAPAFIKANISIHPEKAIAWLETMKNYADDKGYIRLVGKESKTGKRYFELDTWKPTPAGTNTGVQPTYPRPDDIGIDPESTPF